MRERAQHRCRVNFSLLRRCDGSILARLTPTQNQLFTFASVRQLSFRSLSTDAESTFHFCIGATAQFSLAQHRHRVNFSLLHRFDCSVFARSTPMQNQLFAFASVRLLSFRSLSTDAESTFHFCIGVTAHFSLAQHRCRVNFSLLRRYPRFRANALVHTAPTHLKNLPKILRPRRH